MRSMQNKHYGSRQVTTPVVGDEPQRIGNQRFRNCYNVKNACYPLICKRFWVWHL